MHLKRFSDAKPYEAPNHRNYTSLRLFRRRSWAAPKAWSSVIPTSFPAAGRARTLRRQKKSISCCAVN